MAQTSKPVVTKAPLGFSNSTSLRCIRYKPSSTKVYSLEKHLSNFFDCDLCISHPNLTIQIHAYMINTKLSEITLTLATHVI